MTVSYGRWAALHVVGAVLAGGWVIGGTLVASPRPWPAVLPVAMLVGAFWTYNLRSLVLAAGLTPDELVLRMPVRTVPIPRDEVTTRLNFLYARVRRRGRWRWFYLPLTRDTDRLLAQLRRVQADRTPAVTSASYVLSVPRRQRVAILVPAAFGTVLSLVLALAGGELVALAVVPVACALLWWYLLAEFVVRAEATHDELVLTMPARSVRMPLTDVDIVVPWRGLPTVRRRGRLLSWLLPPVEEAAYLARFVRGAQAAPARRPVL